MNVLFDKTSDSKCPTDVNSNSVEDETDDCKHLKKALLESISTGKIGALTVDPQYLDFEALECKFFRVFIKVSWANFYFHSTDKTSNANEEGSIESFFQLSEVRLYTVLGLIAALIFIAIIQAICTIYKTSNKGRGQKVSLPK